MKLILFFVLNYLYLVQITNGKKYRLMVYDEVLSYNLDKSVPPFKNFFAIDNMVLEAIDDDNIEISGYVEAVKSFDRNIPMQLLVQTQSLEQSVWKDQAVKLSMPDICKEFLNPDRFWYNITRLWTADVCPPKQGDKWNIEKQNCTALINLPDNLPKGNWRGYGLLTQVTPMAKFETGFGLEAELVLV